MFQHQEKDVLTEQVNTKSHIEEHVLVDCIFDNEPLDFEKGP